ncbi:MAG: roadblock/LC7 domain-containing protein [Syntrophotaleaceae bacterium]
MFHDILQGILREADGVSAVLMGYDGLPVDQVDRPCDGIDLNLVAVEYANVLKEVKNAVSLLNTGDLEEMAIRTQRFHVIIRALTEEYFVTLTLPRDGNLGKGRYLLLRESSRLCEALR